jgi:hypothetical protein
MEKPSKVPALLLSGCYLCCEETFIIISDEIQLKTIDQRLKRRVENEENN